ncbi:MAG: hypothetical protein M3373_13685 [Gemmatimonadota bacterium]|nr:hypothetical protein [Gemmatimonadota bacterium]
MEPLSPTASRVFLLSPARSDGQRAKLLLRSSAEFPLAVSLRGREGAPLGDVFSFLSGLYFRGKLTYARTFAPSITSFPSVLVITADRGLMSPDDCVRRDDVLAFSSVDIAGGDERYELPLRRDAGALARTLPPATEVVLLGSVASGKYVDALLELFGERLVFPIEFVGRGDMSRGGLLLRHAREGRELAYIPVAGAVRRGKRPPKLERAR